MYIVLVFCILGLVLWVRKNLKHTKYQGRVIPFREPLVPEDFFKICTRDSNVIVWILREYGPDRGELPGTIHAWNLYLKSIGWSPVVFVPETVATAYEEIPIFQFWRKVELENCLWSAKAIGCGPMVLETAALTAKRSNKPLFSVISSTTTTGEDVSKIYPIHRIYTAEWLSASYKLPGTVIRRPLNLKPSSGKRQQITCFVGEGVEFYSLVHELPTKFFLGIGGRASKESNLVVWSKPGNWLEETGILCNFLEEPDIQFVLEAAAAGIPILSIPCPAIREVLPSLEFFKDGWAKRIQELDDPIVYERESRRLAKEAATRTTRADMEELKILLEGRE